MSRIQRPQEEELDEEEEPVPEEQIIAILREQEQGLATAEVCRRHRISSAGSSD